jgi:Flp pilus assembly protein TadD
VSALGRAVRTVEVCTRAFFVLPDSATIASIVAHAELDQGHFGLAEEWARKAVAIDPEMAEPYAFLGFVADQAGRDREARVAYRRYLELAPRGPYAEDINAILREE